MEPASTLPETKLPGLSEALQGIALPLRGGARQEARTMAALVAALQQRGVAARLQGLVAPPSGAAIQQAHLLASLAAMVLSLLWPAAGLFLLLSLTASSLSRSLGGPGLTLAMGRPACNVLIQQDRRRAVRLMVVALDRRREGRLAQRSAVAGIAVACLVPAYPGLFPSVALSQLLLVLALGWAVRPYPSALDSAEHRRLKEFLALLPELSPSTWLVASGAGPDGVKAVLDWWRLDGKVEIVQVGDGPALHAQAKYIHQSAQSS